jgi:hypothetical protein
LTPRRYDAYRRVRTELEVLTQEALADDEKALLLDVAEGMLLARNDADGELDELRGKAAVALSLLVEMDRWSDTTADEMWERLVACGPLERRGTRLARAVEHA